MRIDCALLSDAATIREGLLHVLGGGITRANREAYPAPLDMAFALRLLIHPTEVGTPHAMRIVLQMEDGQPVSEIMADFGGPESLGSLQVLEPGEEVSLSVAIPMHALPLPQPGAYSFEILIDNIHQVSVPFRATQVGPDHSEEDG